MRGNGQHRVSAGLVGQASGVTVVPCKITRLYEKGIKKSRPLPPVAGNLVMFKCDDGTMHHCQ